jgi:hypothetical protein
MWFRRSKIVLFFSVSQRAVEVRDVAVSDSIMNVIKKIGSECKVLKLTCGGM